MQLPTNLAAMDAENTEPTVASLQSELAETRQRLAEAERTLNAIRDGEVDAIVVQGVTGPQTYTLKTASEPYRHIVEQMPEAALTVTADGVIVYCNAAFANMIGRPAERLAGALVAEFASADSMQRLLTSGGNHGCDLTLVPLDGDPIDCRASSTELPVGSEAVYCCVITNLTGQRLKVRHDAIVRASSSAIYVLSPELLIETWNSAAARLHGYAPDEIIGRSCKALCAPGGLEELQNHVARNRRGETVSAEVVRRRKDGTIFEAMINLSALRDAGGDITGFVSISSDISERRKAEAEMQRVNALLDTVLQNAPIGFCLVGRDLRFIRINERLAEVNGIPAEAHLGRHVSEIVPTLVETIRDVTDRILATGEAVLNHEFSGQTPVAPGMTRFWNESWYPVRDGADAIIGFGAIIEDITERRLAEEELRASEERVHNVIDSMFTFVGMIAPDGTLTVANHASVAAAGLSRSDVIGKPFWDCYWWNYDPAVQKRLRAGFDRAVRGEVVRYEETIRVANDGRVVLDFVLKPVFDGGRLLFVIPSAEDITWRKQAEAERQLREADLHASEARFRGTFENAAVGVAHVALDGVWLSVNDKLCGTVGYSREELLAMTFQDITHPDDLAADLGYVRQVLSGEINAYRMEKRHIRKDGSVVWTAITNSLHRRENGDPDHFISIIENIGAQKAAEAQRDLLIGEVMHRSKNQLAIVQAMSVLGARNAPSLDEFLKNFAARIEGLSISTDILVDEHWEGAPLHDLVGRHLQPFGADGDRLICDGPDLFLTAAAAQSIGLALHELATNCVKYGAWSLPTGLVRISWSLDHKEAQPPQLRVSWIERGGPPVFPPTRKGFGSTIMEKMVTQKLGGEVEMTFATQGLTWTVVAPAAAHVVTTRGGGRSTIRPTE